MKRFLLSKKYAELRFCGTLIIRRKGMRVRKKARIANASVESPYYKPLHSEDLKYLMAVQ